MTLVNKNNESIFPEINNYPIEICCMPDSCVLCHHDAESSQFCSNWAQVLLAHGTSSPDPFFLRQAVENYKLKVKVSTATEFCFHLLSVVHLLICRLFRI